MHKCPAELSAGLFLALPYPSRKNHSAATAAEWFLYCDYLVIWKVRVTGAAR